MDNSSAPSFTNLLLSSNSSSDAENPRNSQQHTQQSHVFPPSFPMNYPPQQFGLNFHPYQPNFNPFAAQAGYQQFPSSQFPPSSFPFHGNFGFHPGMDMAGGPSSPVGSVANLGGPPGGSGSRGDEYSPRSFPMAAADNRNKASVDEEWSDVESDEGKRGGRKWSVDDNKRLINAWLNNSVDPIDGNSKKGAHYWKDVAAEYNMTCKHDLQINKAVDQLTLE